jgi:hypothetical protein
MNEYYTDRDVVDFKDVEPKYYLTNKLEEVAEGSYVRNHNAEPQNKKYELVSEYDLDFD